VSKQVNRKCPDGKLSTPYTNHEPANSLPPKFQNLHVWNSPGQYAHHGYSRQLSVAILYKEECIRYEAVSRCRLAICEMFSFCKNNTDWQNVEAIMILVKLSKYLMICTC